MKNGHKWHVTSQSKSHSKQLLLDGFLYCGGIEGGVHFAKITCNLCIAAATDCCGAKEILAHVEQYNVCMYIHNTCMCHKVNDA